MDMALSIIAAANGRQLNQ